MAAIKWLYDGSQFERMRDNGSRLKQKSKGDCKIETKTKTKAKY